VNSLLDRAQAICEEDVQALDAMVDQWNMLGEEKRGFEEWIK